MGLEVGAAVVLTTCCRCPCALNPTKVTDEHEKEADGSGLGDADIEQEEPSPPARGATSCWPRARRGSCTGMPWRTRGSRRRELRPPQCAYAS
uniref:Uncharacterized protein n=1 Tax=Oryza nivara TaxID=4536 RepID=A0A0E0G5F2_ORYNI